MWYKLIKEKIVAKFLLVEEVAKKLRLHPNTVQKYIKEGKLPAAKFRKVYRKFKKFKKGDFYG
jgi:excisionase family DNA binding protein